MTSPVETDSPKASHLWFRVVLPGGAIGPGKADLLAAIDAQGSISGAARTLGMSYKRAWRLVETLNALTGSPFVEAERGGGAGRGARLTPLGREALDLYRELSAELDRTSRPWIERLANLGQP